MGNLRILIVDDLPEVRQGLAVVLELAAQKDGLGITVIGSAGDGHEALEKARRLHPDVILMDLEMPGMDGLEATRRIKAQQPEVRVVILTIHYEHEMQRAARKAGADVFLTKGVDSGNLLNAILGGRGSPEELEKGEGS